MDQSIALEQYKLAVEMADRVSARRHSANAFFLSGITTLTVLNGFVGGESRILASVVCSSTVLLCTIWYFALSGYRALNSAKFSVVQEMEKMLPFQMYAAEEMHYKSKRAKDTKSRATTIRRRWCPLSRTEQYVPMLFGTASIAVLVFRMIWTG